jgi:hypothetical protein
VNHAAYDLRKFDFLSPDSKFYDPNREPQLDFANWDDMFDLPHLHDNLDELMEEGYSVIISFTGSRWYGTMTL